MIYLNRKDRRIVLKEYLFNVSDNELGCTLYWYQYVHNDGSLQDIGNFVCKYYQKRGWSNALRKRILSMKK